MLKSGWQWRRWPKDFPKWRTCYEYFRQWSEEREGGISLLEEASRKVVDGRHLERKQTTRCLMVDAPSVKKTNTAETKALTAANLIVWAHGA
jgi:transposase